MSSAAPSSDFKPSTYTLFFLKYGDIEGSYVDNSPSGSHNGWIPVSSVQFGVGRAIPGAQLPASVREKKEIRKAAKEEMRKAAQKEKEKQKRQLMLEELKRQCEKEGKEYVEPPEEKDDRHNRGYWGRSYGDDDDEEEEGDDEEIDLNALNRGASKPSVSEITVTKLFDSSSLDLFAAAVNDKTGRDCLIHVVKKSPILTGGVKPTKEEEVKYEYSTILEFKLSAVVISGFSMSGGERRSAVNDTVGTTESVSLNFVKIQLKTFGPKGGEAFYDLIRTKGGISRQ